MVERSKYLSVIFILLPFIAQAKFVHPGLLNSKEELVFMKENRGWPTPEELDSPYYRWDEPDKAGEPWYFFEMVYNHYHNRLALAAPNTQQILTESVTDDNEFPVRPEKQSRTGGWGTATHVSMGKQQKDIR